MPRSARYSSVLFFSPNPDALIECLEPCQGPERPARYPPITAGDWTVQLHAYRVGLFNPSTRPAVGRRQLELSLRATAAPAARVNALGLSFRPQYQVLIGSGTGYDQGAIADSGLVVESAIGFAAFLHEGETERQKGLDEAKRSMDLVRQIGGVRIAAPPVGVTDKSGLDPLALAQRYRALCELGAQMDVLPQLELWGFSKTLSRLGEVAYTGIEAAHPAACFLLDVYHIYKGGSGFEGLALFPGARMHCFHINDYPADPPRETIADRHRVYPGDGVAPLDKILRTLRDIGFRGALSLELFNPDYWKQDAEVVVRTGLEKMRAAVAKALA